jgi:hypothetical protein
MGFGRKWTYWELLLLLFDCLKVLWHIDPLLGKDVKTNNKKTAIAMQ